MTNMSRKDAITLCIELVKPLADMNKNIQDKISTVKGKLDEVQRIDPDKSDVDSMAKTITTKLNIVKLDKPQAVCGSIKCIGVTTSMSGKKAEDYKQICHETCFITGVSTNVPNQEQIKECEAMDYQTNDPNCLHCACSWKVHMHRTYKTIEKEQEVEDTGIKEIIVTTNDNTEMVKLVTESLKEKIKILEGEQKVVTQISALVAAFLEQCNNNPAGIVFTSGYLDHQIGVQESLVALGNSRDLLERMMTTRSRYTEELDLAGQVAITPEDILKSLKKLYNLPETGDQIRRTIEAVISVDISGRIDSVEAGISGLNLVSAQTDSLTTDPTSSKLKLPTIVPESQ